MSGYLSAVYKCNVQMQTATLKLITVTACVRPGPNPTEINRNLFDTLVYLD